MPDSGSVYPDNGLHDGTAKIQIVDPTTGVAAVVDGDGHLTTNIAGDITITNVNVVEPLSVDDNGGSLTVDGPLTDAELRADAVLVEAEPIEWAIANHATYEGAPASSYSVLGRRDLGWSSNSVLGDCCQYLDTSQALMNTPTAGQTLYIVSTSANDTILGSGARQVRVVYLDSNGDLQVVTKDMNGTTPVSMGTGFTFIQWMEVASLGTSEVSEGNIAVTSTNGAATVATTFEFIKAGGNRSMSGRFKVPRAKHALLIDWFVASIATTMDCRLRATVFSDDRAISTVYHFVDCAYLASGQNAAADLHYLRFPALSVIKISAIPGNTPAQNRLDSNFHLVVLDGV